MAILEQTISLEIFYWTTITAATLICACGFTKAMPEMARLIFKPQP